MKVIVKFFWDCGRSGTVEGIFTCNRDEIEQAVGKEVYFGEILGKHSEIYGTLDASDMEILSDDQEFIAKFEEIMGEGTVSGYNPLEYISEINEDDEYDDE